MRLRDFQLDINKKIKMLSEVVGGNATRAFLTSALEFFRPHHLALGLRISRLSTTHVEVVVPVNKRSLNDQSELDPGILTTATTLGVQLLLRRIGQPEFEGGRFEEAHLQRWGDLRGELRGRAEFDKLQQEVFRAELRKQGHSDLELEMNFFDSSEKRVAACKLILQCRASDQISWISQDNIQDSTQKGENGHS